MRHKFCAWSPRRRPLLLAASTMALIVTGLVPPTSGPAHLPAALAANTDRSGMRALQQANRVRATVYGIVVSGTSSPRSPITVTLRADNGDERATQQVTTSAGGTFEVELADKLARAVPIMPGDTLEITRVTGDPMLIPIPELDAWADLGGNAVVGRVPPSATVAVSAEYGADGRETDVVTVATHADGDGAFRADFTGQRVLARGMGGQVIVTNGAVDLVFGWAAPRITVDLAASFPNAVMVMTNIPSGRTVHVRVMAPDGKLVLETQQTPTFVSWPGACCMTSLNMPLRGPDGTFFMPRAGDRVELAVGADLTSLTLPPLAATIYAADDRLQGHTLPAAAVTIELLHNQMFGSQGGRTLTTTADASGLFEHSFRGDYDIRYNDLAILTVAVGDHLVRRQIGVPGLTFNLDDGTIAGALAPDAQVSLQLRDGQGLRGSAELRADTEGRFVAQPRDADGQAVALHAGDTVEVRAVDAPDADTITTTVPELTLSWDRTAGTVFGRATPGGQLAVRSNKSDLHIYRSESGNASPPIAPDGSYVGPMMPAKALGRGNVLEARYRSPDDHLAYVRRVVPMAKVPHGGATVCGYGPPGAAVSATLEDAAGKVVASASGTVAPSLHYELTLREPGGMAAVSHAGQKVRVHLGEDDLAVALPEATIRLDPATGKVSGIAPAGAPLLTVDPDDRCFYRDSPARDGGWTPGGGKVGADGRYVVGNGSVMRPGEGIQLTVFDADDNAFYLQAYRLLGQVYVGTPRIGGRTTAGSTLSAELLGPGGVVRGTGRAKAAPEGGFDLHIADTSGSASAAQPGDVVRLADGQESVDIRVETLNFDFSARLGVLGQAPASRSVRLQLMARGQMQTFTTTSDASGKWHLSPADIPSRAGWTLADVSLIRATLFTIGGHELVAEAKAMPEVATPTPAMTATASPSPTREPPPSATTTPSVAKGRVFLPFAAVPRAR